MSNYSNTEKTVMSIVSGALTGVFVVGIMFACGYRRVAQAQEPPIVMTPTPYSERGTVWVLTIDGKFKLGRYKGSFQHGINGTPSTWTSDNGSLMSTKATVLFESDPAPKSSPSPLAP